MANFSFSFLIGFFILSNVYSQNTSITGVIIDADSATPIKGVIVSIKDTNIYQLTNLNGVFTLNDIHFVGAHFLTVMKDGYESKTYKINIKENHTLDISTIILKQYLMPSNDYAISLSEDELDSDESVISNTSGILQSSKDIFSKAAAYDFSGTFYKLRGLGSENSIVLINGIKMNKLLNGRPQWNNWGGINNVLRNQNFTNGSKANEFVFGDIGGITTINLRASLYKKGTNISYALSNRTYRNRIMATHATGLTKKEWSFSFSLGRRWADNGYVSGTHYESNSIFASVEKSLNAKHSVNFSALYTPNIRGKSASVSDEVYSLKNNKYNPYWGVQNGEVRNSRIRKISEPIFILSHYWQISDRLHLNNNMAYQFGYTSNSKLEFNGSNPAPDYYQNLPSYALRFDTSQSSLATAYSLEQQFINNGQLNWNSMYDANISNPNNALYILYEDIIADKNLKLNSILDVEVTDNVLLNASINFNVISSHNYAKTLDFLGATSYLDKDYFSNIDSNIQTPSRIVGEGDIFKYNYNINALSYNVFVQSQFSYSKIDFYVGGEFGSTQYQRNGFYADGHFSNKEDLGISSFGKGEKLNFTLLGFKAGGTYKITGKHLLDANVALINTAPSIRNSFLNSRQNNLIVPDLDEVKKAALDINYFFRSRFVNIKFSSFFSKIKDATDLSFFYIDGISGATDARAFVQEATTNISYRNIGFELGIEAKITPTIVLKGALGVRESIYANNPNVYLSSDKFIDVATNPYDDATSFPSGVINFGTATLENYKLPGGPQHAASIGFEYRDPKYWWFGTTANFFSNAYIDISTIARTANFALDQDGIPIVNYDVEISKELLRQEQFDDFMLVNLVGGKSFKFGFKYLSFFASINNVLNTSYKTGGFEQSRNGNYSQMLADSKRVLKIFGPKYWFGRGTNYFMNMSLRF
jgi:hypothetical protein